jgi:cell division septum initiation protein DivIVA
MLAEAANLKEQMITEARERATGMVAEAQQKKAALLEELETQKSQIERTIEQLRGFERTYRGELRSYFEGKLHELDASTVQSAAESTAAEHDPVHS